MNFVLALRTTGLVLADLDPRLYLNEATAVAVPGGASLGDLGGGNYLASGWPDGSRSLCYTLTYTYGGVWYSKAWGGWVDFGGAPGRVILPARLAGLDEGDLAPVLYRDGEPQAVTFSASELGSPGDYLLSGWEVRAEGASCLLTWEPGGEISWRERAAPVVSAEGGLGGGLGGMWRDLAPVIGRTLGSTAAHPSRGERVILRRPSSLETMGGSPPSALQLAADAPAGAMAVALELPDGGKLTGTLLAGARLTIEGEDYTLAADAPASGVSLAVTLTAGLATPAASETPVTVHSEARFIFEDCIVHRRLRRDLARPLQADHMAVIMAPAKGAPTTPVMNDSLELEDGTVGRVANQVISGGAFWRLQMG